MPNAPRVTFLITDLFQGGSPRVLATLAPGLVRRGFEIDVVSMDAVGDVGKELRGKGVEVTTLRTGIKHDLRMVPRFIKHVRARTPRVICSILVHANLLAAFARPHIKLPAAWVHSIHTLQEKPRWHWHATAIAMGMADGFVAPSRAIIRKLEGHGMVPRPTVIPNGIDVKRFYNAGPIPADESPWPAGAFVLGYIGRFDPVKRLPLLLRTVRYLLDGAGGIALGNLRPIVERLHVAMIGWGRQEYELRRLTAELRLTKRVHFLKPTPTPEQWYKTFDVFCLPSRAEGFGLTLAEATVAGIPIITCDTHAIRETIDHATWLTEDPSVEELSRGILETMRSASLRTPPTNTLETWEARFGEAQMVERYATYFESLARNLI